MGQRCRMISPVINPVAIALLLVVPVAGAAQQTDSVPLYSNLGEYNRKVTTRSPIAQQYFNQGLRLTYGFGHPEGVRSFKAALRQDSACAMCWWGVAWARGPYINARMDSAGGVEAYNAIQRAIALKPNVTAVERALIDAMATRYVAVPTRDNRARLDSAYVNAMREVARRYPRDLDAGALFGESLMVLRPWDQWTRTGDPKPGTEEVLVALERVLSRDIRHPGACHSYVHAVEASRRPERAEKCAEFLGQTIPGASHIPHMPSHIWLRIGRYADGVIANTKAWHIDQQAAFGGPPGIYPTHNLHMLLTAAAFDGQSAVAAQAARDLSRFGANAFYPMAIAVRFGRWQEILESTWQPTQGYHRGVRAFALGLAHLANDRPDSARVQLARVDSIIAATPDSLEFRSHPQKSLLGMARAHLAGEILASQKRYDEAIRELEKALPLEDSLDYDEPEPWPIPARHILGAILLEAGRAADAERVYQDDLFDHPRNGWALYGLERALRAQNKIAEADAVKKRFTEAWARADTWLLSSRFAPRKPGPANLLHVH
jgi:tetratricopeptide (TPR) repeat protein